MVQMPVIAAVSHTNTGKVMMYVGGVGRRMVAWTGKNARWYDTTPTKRRQALMSSHKRCGTNPIYAAHDAPIT